MAEVLVASVVGSVLMIGSAQSLKFALQSAQVSSSILTENDLRASIPQGLKEGLECAKHLEPAKLTNTNADHKSKGIGTVTEGLPGVKLGDFNGDIEVKKIELTGDPTDQNKRTLVVYYKKTGLGKLNTMNGGACSSTDTTGCFYNRCSIDYTAMFDQSNYPSPATSKECSVGGCYSQSTEAPPPTSLPANVCDPGEFIRAIDEEGNTECAPACSGGRDMWEVLTYNSPGGNGFLEYIVGNQPEIQSDWHSVRKTRHCACPTGTNWDETNCVTCTSEEKWVWSEKACMTCPGGTWRNHYYNTRWDCRCPDGYVKKKKIQSIVVKIAQRAKSWSVQHA